MDFRFSDDQRALQDATREFLSKESGPDRLRTDLEAGMTFSPARWAGLADLGLLGITSAEHLGGMSMSIVDAVLPIEESGRAALPELLGPTIGLIGPALSAAGLDDLVRELAAGTTCIAAQTDGSDLLSFAEQAGFFLLTSGEETHLIATSAVRSTPQTGIDFLRPTWSVEWAPTPATRIDVDTHDVRNRAALVAAAESLGVAQQLIDMSVAYAQQREQFGKPIGAFQAIKHHLASALVKVEFARPAVYRAAVSVRDDDHQKARDVSMAKILATEAAEFSARIALQVHGAIGYTWEHNLHFWLRRTWSLAASGGSKTWHRRRVADALGI